MAFRLGEEKEIIAVEPIAKLHVLALFEKKLETPGDVENIANVASALEFMQLANCPSGGIYFSESEYERGAEPNKDFEPCTKGKFDVDTVDDEVPGPEEIIIGKQDPMAAERI